MILLDTNLVSELARPAPDAHVMAWFDAQQWETLYLCAITVAELRVGIATLPPGRKRRELDERLERRLLPLFAGRVRPFEMECTRVYADLVASARASGIAVTLGDGLIAAIALTNGFRVATRDTRPFAAAGVDAISPWGAEC